MLFSSIIFIYAFLPIVLFFYYVLFRNKRSKQNIVLLIASLFFYAWGEPKFVIVMVASILVNWFLGLIIGNEHLDQRFSRLWLGISVVFNLGLLFVFKYLNFTGGVIERLVGLNFDFPTIALPIGISFFTFQAMSYIFDVYYGNCKAQTNLLYLGLYIAFFPQLVAGPIVRYQTIADEIIHRKENIDDFVEGFARFVVGLSKKVLLANSFAVIANQAFDTVHNGESISVLFGWLGAIAYTLQIFFDFSGYSDMAIGLGRMFGFHFLENFNYPYISTSITEFWRRWHISLGTWFRDYLYIPLGGSYCSRLRNTLNLLVVWLLTGIWHGANVTFILWGLMYFVLLTAEKITGINRSNGVLRNVSKWAYTLFFVILGWVLFRAESVYDAVQYFAYMFGVNGNNFIDGIFTSWFTQNMILFGIGILLSTPIFCTISTKTRENSMIDFVKLIGLACLLLLSIAALISSTYNPFIYFNF